MQSSGFIQLVVSERNILSSPEPLGSQGELIVYPSSRRPSVRRRPPFSKIFSSETAWPIKTKFYVEQPWEGGTKVYESLYKWSRSHDQDGRHAHIW